MDWNLVSVILRFFIAISLKFSRKFFSNFCRYFFGESVSRLIFWMVFSILLFICDIRRYSFWKT